jgi:uncharacterized protein YndB with AHSA1/START domain
VILKTKYDIEQFVYSITDPDQHKMQVVEITVKPGGAIVYTCSYSNDSSTFYEFELTDEKTTVIE